MPYPFDNCDNDQKLVGVLSDLWTRTMLAHQPEVDRLQMLEMLYQGFHYRHPRANREKEITNYCFSTVETVYPVMVERRPRPEAVPRPGAILPSSKAEQLQKVATWWQDIAAVDRVRRTQTRVKLKSGYNVTVLTVDPQTGIPFIVDWSPFDFYPDPSARNVELAEYFFFAAPIATRRLKAMFPGMAAKIYADNYVSPSYDAVVRPYIENYAGLSRATRPYSGAGPRATNLESTSPYQSNPQPTGNTNYVFAPYSTAVHRGSDTSFLLQLIVRDYSRWPGVHAGTLLTPAPPEAGPDPLETPWYMPLDYPCCPSGWRLITFLANGTILANEPVDECFDGLPFVVGYDYRHEGRIAGIGEIDNIASINRAINERKNLINQANRLAGNPPLIATKGSGIDWDGQGVTAGDVLEPSRGSDIHWLEYQGPSEHQFEQLQVEYKDIDTVSGVHDAQQGQRPAGIEAAAAIRELQDAAATRIRGKAPEDLDEWARILTKAVKILAKKCRSDLWFHATGGDPTSISPSMLDGEWDFRFTEGTSDQQAKHERDDMALQLFQLGVLGPADLLQQLDWPNGQQIAQNAMLRQMAMAQAQSAGPKGPPPKGGGPPPPNQGGPPPGGQ
jgi:hypothetical protein